MKNVLKKIKAFFENTLAFWIVTASIATCAVFLCIGVRSENGSITLDGKDAVISDNIKKAMEDFEDAIYRITEQDAPTDEETAKLYEQDEVGLGFYTTLSDIIARRLPDGDNDNGLGWQCSKYTGYLSTGKREYSTAHPDYGPVNGKDIAGWLVKNYGFKYIDTPVAGAIGSGAFNTTYGHTAMYLYSTGTNTAMVNDANYTPLKVSTHNMNIADWVWVVPGNYEPTITPDPVSVDSYVVQKGDTLGGIALNMGWCNGCKLFGDDGYTQALAEHNNIAWRGLIFPGQLIYRK